MWKLTHSLQKLTHSLTVKNSPTPSPSKTHLAYRKSSTVKVRSRSLSFSQNWKLHCFGHSHSLSLEIEVTHSKSKSESKSENAFSLSSLVRSSFSSFKLEEFYSFLLIFSFELEGLFWGINKILSWIIVARIFVKAFPC